MKVIFTSIYIVILYLFVGDLNSYLKRVRGTLPEEEAKKIVLSVDYELEFMINLVTLGLFRIGEIMLLITMY